MKHLILPVTILLATVAGCPQPGTQQQTGLSPQIGVSSTRGLAPLTISVSAADSTSDNGEITLFQWDFAGQATADTVAATHRFELPGRYVVTLTVSDSTGAQNSASVVIQVQGTETPVAVIASDVSSGPVPLNVRFDGSQSSVADDTITDFFWDFGDGTESRLRAPFHAYNRAGTFVVELRVATGGGLEGTATTTIVVGASDASLQFNGSQRATLPVAGSDALTAVTFETWLSADTGGEVAAIGTDFKIEVLPGSDTIRVTVGGEAHEATLANLAGSWQHIAVAFVSGGESVIYHDGDPLATFESSATITPADLVVGRGYRGNLGEMRLWSSQRSASQIGARMDVRLGGTETDLLGAWPMNAGAGQTVANRALTGTNGVLGDSDAAEAFDPAWSTNAPPLP